MCTERGFVNCDGILKYKLKVGLVIRCAKTLDEATVFSHYPLGYRIKFHLPFNNINP